MVAEQPDNLVLRMLREMRTILDDHSEQFKSLHKAIEDWKETTATRRRICSTREYP